MGNFVAALPTVGMAPVLVMWFGFDWQSTAAVVVVMVFFPMLANTLQGLSAANTIDRDLMHTYAASYWRALFKLRLSATMPHVFNSLKITTIAIKMSAARAGSGLGRDRRRRARGPAFYGSAVRVEKTVTFWHPAQRGRRVSAPARQGGTS